MTSLLWMALPTSLTAKGRSCVNSWQGWNNFSTRSMKTTLSIGSSQTVLRQFNHRVHTWRTTSFLLPTTVSRPITDFCSPKSSGLQHQRASINCFLTRTKLILRSKTRTKPSSPTTGSKLTRRRGPWSTQSTRRKRWQTKIWMLRHSDHNRINNNNNNDTHSNKILDTKATSKGVNKATKNLTPKSLIPQTHKAVQAIQATASSVVTAKS